MQEQTLSGNLEIIATAVDTIRTTLDMPTEDIQTVADAVTAGGGSDNPISVLDEYARTNIQSLSLIHEPDSTYNYRVIYENMHPDLATLSMTFDDNVDYHVDLNATEFEFTGKIVKAASGGAFNPYCAIVTYVPDTQEYRMANPIYLSNSAMNMTLKSGKLKLTDLPITSQNTELVLFRSLGDTTQRMNCPDGSSYTNIIQYQGTLANGKTLYYLHTYSMRWQPEWEKGYIYVLDHTNQRLIKMAEMTFDDMSFSSKPAYAQMAVQTDSYNLFVTADVLTTYAEANEYFNSYKA